MNGLENNKRVSYFEYDFAKHGGVVGDIVVNGNGIPKGALILDGIVDVKDAVLSGGAAELAITAESAGDILAATGKATLATDALLDTVPNGTAANAVRVSSALNSLTFSPSVADLTAGRVVVALDWVLTD